MIIFPFLLITLSLCNEISTDVALVLSPFLNSQVRPLRQIDQIFLKLPTFQEIDQLVLNGDGVAIQRTIQAVVSNSQLQCDYKISYLLQIEGRIRSGIHKKSLLAKQVLIITSAARKQIARLENANQRLSTQKRLLFIEQSRFSLSLKLKDLQSRYEKFNKLEKQIQNKKILLKNVQQKLSVAKNALQNKRQSVTYLLLQLAEVQAKIKIFGPQQQSLKNQKSIILVQLSKMEREIQNQQLDLYQIQRQINSYQRQIQGLRNQLDSTQTQYLQLQVSMNNYRDQIAEGEQKQDKINEEIASNNQKITNQNNKILSAEYDNLKNMIETLQNRLPSLQQQISIQYYYCYTSPQAVSKVSYNSTVYYVIQGQYTQTYITNAYGNLIEKIPNKLQLLSIDIFSNQWASQYGPPFNTEQVLVEDSYSQFTIASDFFCLNPSQTSIGLGRIQAIYERIIVIKDTSNQMLALQIGSCTHLQCSNCIGSAISVGSQIIWRGQIHTDAKNYVQLYAGTIF